VGESIEVLRALWTQPRVTFRGRWHTIVDAGLNPLPVQRPIPIWIGGDSDAALRRAARLADGWMPGMASYSPPLATAESRRDLVERLRRYIRDAGRRADEVGIEVRIALSEGGPPEWRRAVDEWRALGATHISVQTTGAGLRTPSDHVAAAGRFLETVRGIL
jgi:alkanesulfonate monooxygenase SsuD/methylene tetrahydromethanopterin reductase-like flavin-dependent oxidoreductase (luciferase family)